MKPKQKEQSFFPEPLGEGFYWVRPVEEPFDKKKALGKYSSLEELYQEWTNKQEADSRELMKLKVPC